MDSLKTYGATPSIALARMAWRLAWKRVWGDNDVFEIQTEPNSRVDAEAGFADGSAEYYRILDRIARGEAP